jgi:hypothetical protein
VLLGDQPHAVGEDPLGFDLGARELADLILDSRGSTPFTLGIEVPWGIRRSTLMTRLCDVLAEDDDIRPVRFNGWTPTTARAGRCARPTGARERWA